MNKIRTFQSIMFSSLKLAWQCLFSPQLYKIYREGPTESVYQPKTLEKWGDNVVLSAIVLWNLSLYSSPLICMFMYRRGMFMADNTVPLIKFVTGVGFVVFISLCMRAIGRMSNSNYKKFIATLDVASNNQPASLEALREYDFHFSAWPVNFSMDMVEETKSGHRAIPQRSSNSSVEFRRLPLKILSTIAIRTFGLRIIYPGSIKLLQAVIWAPLLQGRVKLVKDHNGKRFKLETVEKNHVDCMFVDKRKDTNRGQTVIVCCDGNSGFYEIGVMTVAAEAGYSAVGWNHPGFGGSTGEPYPRDECIAIDTVMQFTIHKLGFQPENIILMGWSIGGFPACWAAANYPDVKAVILDATFDDLLPLAVARMPKSWASLVSEAISSHVNLNVGEELIKYKGPVAIIRRTLDEIIALEEGVVGTNRGNNLLMKLLKYRHSNVIGASQELAIREYLALQEPQKTEVLSEMRHSPNDNDKAAAMLITRYLKDFRTTHCTPMPPDMLGDIETMLNNQTRIL